MTTPLYMHYRQRRSRKLRSSRAVIRSQINSGNLKVQEVLADPPEEMRTAQLHFLFISLPGCANCCARLIAKKANLSTTQRLGDLTLNQRAALVEALESRPSCA